MTALPTLDWSTTDPEPSAVDTPLHGGVALLDSAVALTRDRERATLHTSLLRTLGEMLPLTEIRVLPAGTPTGRFPDTRDGMWYSLPLASALGDDRVLAVHIAGEGEQEEHILQGFVRLYQNFLTVIDESERDRLTQLRNRAAFDTRLARLAGASSGRHARRSGDASDWLALIDVDHFKRVNDRFGHLYGDEVLILMARHLRASFRERDAVFRYGGEEFAVLLGNSSRADARAALERFRALVAEAVFPRVGAVSVSIGFCAIDPGSAPPTLVERADRALYAAKEGGRNRVVDYRTLASRFSVQKPAPSDIELF